MTYTPLKLMTSAALIAACGLSCSSRRGASDTATYYGTSGNSTYSYTAAPQRASAQTKSGEETAPSQESTQAGSQMIIPLYQENVVVGKREVDSGTVRIKKYVKTETVNQPVELRHETVSITREGAPAGSQTAAQSQNQGQAFQEQEFTIQLRREEPVVQTQVVESGRIVAQKQDQPEKTTVQRQVRREEVAFEKGNTPDVHVSDTAAVGAASSPGAVSSGSGSSSTITDLSTLSQTTDASSISGRSVQVSGLKVQQVVDPALIAVTGEGLQVPLYVHLQQPVDNLQVGDKINLNGTLQAASKAPALASSLSASAAQKLNAQPFFVEAQSAQLNKE